MNVTKMKKLLGSAFIVAVGIAMFNGIRNIYGSMNTNAADSVMY